MLQRGLFAFVCAIMMTLAACGGNDNSTSSGSSSASTAEELSLILAVGDSIGTGHYIATPWPSRVQASTGVTVINKSEQSRKTSDVIGAVPAWMDEYKPSHLIILLGTNDARGGSVEGAIANLTNWTNSARQRGITVVIGTIPPITADAGANQRAALISNGIQSIGGARIAQVRDAMGDGRGLLADGIHPNNAGQNVIADAFLKQLN